MVNRLLRHLVGLIALSALLAACGSTSPPGGGLIDAVGAENEYANVIEQIGGAYVHVTAIESNPNTDPHTFEATPSTAEAVSSARLVIENGFGYDSFMERIESATAPTGRRVINVQRLLHSGSTSNPHIWYQPGAMARVAAATARDLAALDPAHAAYFKARELRFEQTLEPWYAAIAKFKAAYPNTPVATSEPVADYMLEAAGTKDLTPFSLQSAIMNGTDPAPQDVALEEHLLSAHLVKVFVYNEQVTDTLTNSFKELALKHGVPVLGVYETMPPGYDYQSWMRNEVIALEEAVAEKLPAPRH